VIPSVISRFFWRIGHGVINVVRYGPTIWRTREFDHAYLLELMALKFRYMAEHHEKHRFVSRWEEIAKQLRICQTLCERLRYEDHFLNDYPFAGKCRYKAKEAHIQQDLDYLALVMHRHLRCWWD
jgi:hypothetical protein